MFLDPDVMIYSCIYILICLWLAGRIKIWWDLKGHGLIECEELRATFPGQDGVFLHESQRRHFRKGEEVTFAVPRGGTAK